VKSRLGLEPTHLSYIPWQLNPVYLMLKTGGHGLSQVSLGLFIALPLVTPYTSGGTQPIWFTFQCFLNFLFGLSLKFRG
jgi:hypothetical protein